PSLPPSLPPSLSLLPPSLSPLPSTDTLLQNRGLSRHHGSACEVGFVQCVRVKGVCSVFMWVCVYVSVDVCECVSSLDNIKLSVSEKVVLAKVCFSPIFLLARLIKGVIWGPISTLGEVEHV